MCIHLEYVDAKIDCVFEGIQGVAGPETVPALVGDHPPDPTDNSHFHSDIGADLARIRCGNGAGAAGRLLHREGENGPEVLLQHRAA